MAHGGILGNGVKVGVSLTSPFSLQKLEQVMDVVVPQFISDKLNTTRHGTRRLKSYMSGLTDVTDTTIKCLSDHDPATSPVQDLLKTLSLSKEKVWWRIEIPTEDDPVNGDYLPFEFEADVGSYAVETPVEGFQVTNFVLRFRGDDFAILDPAPSQMS